MPGRAGPRLLAGLLCSAAAAAEPPAVQADFDGLALTPEHSPASAISAGVADWLEPEVSGWRLSFDNDFLTLTRRDHDYTTGLRLTLCGRRAAEGRISLEPARDWLDRRSGLAALHEAGTSQLHAMEYGVLWFSPADIERPRPDDRPFASLLYLANSRSSIAASDSRIYRSGFTVGALGTPVARGLQSAVHELFGHHDPDYAREVSAGGEPTLRYTAGRRELLAAGPDPRRHELTFDMAGSLGYVTEASVSFGGRWGLIDTPWWSYNHEHADYLAQPAPVAAGSGARSLYLWGGVRLRARVYNAFLQGQLRETRGALSFNELNHLLGEAWLGVTSRFASGLELSYVLSYQTREIAEGSGARNPVWAGLVLTRSF